MRLPLPSSPTTAVYWHDDGYAVITRERAHRVYEAFDVTGATLHKNEEAAENEYIAAYKQRHGYP